MFYIGVDFGGTKIEAAALSENGNYLARRRIDNPGSYDAALQTIRDLVEHVHDEAENQLPLGDRMVPGIGIGAPGSVSPLTGVIRNSNATWLNGRDFRADIQSVLGRPVKLSNDANCLALSEATDGAGTGYHSVAAIILGTGCGGGLVVGNQLIEGRNGVAGEVGHSGLPFPTLEEVPGAKCWCGQSGCVETWISGTGFARDFNDRTGRSLKSEDIVLAIRSGDVDALSALDRYQSRLARTLAGIVNLYDPDAFVFGGGLSNVPEIFDGLADRIRGYVFSDMWEGALLTAKWGDASGVRGAAYLWRA